MTPSELKYQYEKHTGDPHFFSRATMKFFGDTMKNFGVRKEKIFIRYVVGKTLSNPVEVEVWALYRKRAVKNGLNSIHYFHPETFKIVYAAGVQQ